MSRLPALFELLDNSGVELSMFDIGRRIQPVSGPLMHQFEQFKLAYPTPLMQQAWFALIQKFEHEEAIIWFLRYPLDENAKLQPAAREYMSNRLAEISTNNIQNNADALKDNPYVFKPKTERLALFHSLIARQNKLPPSSHFKHALDYFSGKLGWQQWSFIGYQGIADIAIRSDQQDISDTLSKAIPYLPEQPLIALCHCMESSHPKKQLIEAIIKRLHTEYNKPQISSALIRAMSGAKVSATLNEQLYTIFQTSELVQEAEILAAIAAKGWQWLYDPKLAQLYLEATANQHPQIFNQLISDLMFIPDLRKQLLIYMRSGKQSDILQARFQLLTGSKTENHSI